MSSGILGQAAPSAATNTTVYTVPASTVATFTLSIVNRGGSVAKVRVAMSATGTPSSSEFIEYDATLSASGVLERTGLVMGATKNLVVYSDSADLSVSAFGFEE